MVLHRRTGKAWLVGLVLCSWVPTAWAESPRPPRMSLWDKLWSSRPSNTWSPTDRRTAGARGPIVISPLPPEVQAEALRAEQEAYLRRVAVCTELRRVAVERGDETLYRQADELEREAEALYRLRVGRLGIQLPRSQDKLAHNNTPRLDQEEQIRAAARRLSPPSPSMPATAEVRVREVKP
ncbi:MAG: hypothetical protein WHU94_03440 [Thermogemmata sp.]|jgi:hypothetical protein|uniref:Uncharacterized protein n=1 Tax=Thermogemmata fonticola TaxID=2755323 RepID=A0A7V8VFI6_9BACT|nr:hypothetical protein [Thermogemmata fonticola]MBA2227098.1 hypothetical protein [Thermogemmata fonticola]MCX8138999.1 hypothetical protein [Gemmataceae bacterium]